MIPMRMADEDDVDPVIGRLASKEFGTHVIGQVLIICVFMPEQRVKENLGLAIDDHHPFIGKEMRCRLLAFLRVRGGDAGQKA